MAKKQKVAEYIHHTGPSTHEEPEKNGITDVLQRDQLRPYLQQEALT